jgi:hypothetical protein
MTQIRIPDPPMDTKPESLNAYFAALTKSLRLNITSINQGAVFTQSSQGTSSVYNNQSPWINGTGTPEGVVSAPVGSLYTDNAGSPGLTLYVKETGTGNTGWQAK